MRSTRSSKEVKKHVNLLELLEADPPDFYIKKVNEETEEIAQLGILIMYRMIAIFLNLVTKAQHIVSPSAGKMKGKRVVRVPWNEKEMEEIQMYFKDYIELKTNKKCPGMKDCILAINKSKAANGEIWKRSWETIKKKVSHLIVAKRKNLE